VIKGGTVIDPANNLEVRRDVALAVGRVAAVEADIPASEATRSVDATGLVVTPGLIDFHMHAYWGGTDVGLDPDRYCLPRGVTTVVDGGSAGAHNFLAFRRLVIDQAKTRVRAFLHISTIGQVDVRPGELSNLAYIDREAAAKCIREHRDVILGLKLRLSRDAVGANSLRPLEMAREVADEVKVPIMVHIGDSEAPLAEIAAMLRPGDIITHYLTPRRHGILDEQGSLLPVLAEAVARGIKLDVAQGRPHVGFKVAQAAFAAGLLPDTISSDVVTFSVHGIVKDLPNVMDKFLALGLSLPQVIERTTSKPAAMMGMEGEIGTLTPGAVADVTAFAVEDGEFRFVDPVGEEITGRQRLVPRLVFRAGEEVQVQEV
jgi:dihydroorotase